MQDSLYRAKVRDLPCALVTACHLAGSMKASHTLQERWEGTGTEFLPGTGREESGEGGTKRYMPFSVGPRQCIGQSLAHMMVNTTCQIANWCSVVRRSSCCVRQQTSEQLQIFRNFIEAPDAAMSTALASEALKYACTDER
jgi:hypothetical protein